MSLTAELNKLFRKPRAAKKTRSVVVVDGVAISKIGGLWTAEVGGRVHKNSRLGDIKDIIRQQSGGDK